MLVNQNTALSTGKTLLVPYSKHHVAKYHEWMQDADLQAATASEPLTMDEEYDMQNSWRTDRDKLTFIVCLPIEQIPQDLVIKQGVYDGAQNMIGDVNLFLASPDDDDEYDEVSEKETSDTKHAIVGELELMIAEKNQRGRGFGKAVLLGFMVYVLSHWEELANEFSAGREGVGHAIELKYLRARINSDNVRSIRLFQSLGFEQHGNANYFGQVELRWDRSLSFLQGMDGYEKADILAYCIG